MANTSTSGSIWRTSPPSTRPGPSSKKLRHPWAIIVFTHCIATSGSPVLEGAIGYLDCRLHATHVTGDHEIFIGEVLELGFEADGSPLIFHGGRYKLVAPG